MNLSDSLRKDNTFAFFGHFCEGNENFRAASALRADSKNFLFLSQNQESLNPPFSLKLLEKRRKILEMPLDIR